MNRRETRGLKKKLGISEAFKKLNLSDKFDEISKNILAGKRQSADFMDAIKTNNAIKIEKIEADKIYVRATEIAKTQLIPFVDAMAEAQNELNSYHKKQ